MLINLSNTSRKIAVLIDPDYVAEIDLRTFLVGLSEAQVDVILLGGSLLAGGSIEDVVDSIKQHTDIPVIIFPGSAIQVASNADGILFLSLISGRNPEFLIGQQVIAAPYIKKANIQPISTGYILVDCGSETTASYISGTKPLPFNKPQIAAATALAGEMLGMEMIYLDGGSGADKPIDKSMISAVRSEINLPIIVGGGLRTVASIETAFSAGANMVVVGTMLEKSPDFIEKIKAIKERL